MMQTKPRTQTVRRGVQAAFLALCAWIGLDFALFLRAGQVPHPAGAEGFLPISALLSLTRQDYLWLIPEAEAAGQR